MHHLILNINWDFLDHKFGGEKVSNYLLFSAIILGTLLLKRPLSNIMAMFSSFLTKRFAHNEKQFKLGALIVSPLERLLQVVLFYVAFDQLDGILDTFVLPKMWAKRGAAPIQVSYVLDHIFLFLFIFFLTQLFAKVIDFLYHRQMEKARQENDTDRQQLLPLVKEMGKLLLWTISAFWIMGSVFKVNIPALIAGLGIGGVAIALAAKESVENLFAAFTILTDKPFQTGDTIKIGDIEGKIERIGFRSTRLRNGDGAAFIIPNQKFVSENLLNLSNRSNRTIKVAINIRYGVSQDVLNKMIADLKQKVQLVADVMQPVEVAIENFGINTFQIIVQYSLPTTLSNNVSLTDKKQEINLLIHEVITTNTGFKSISTEDSEKA